VVHEVDGDPLVAGDVDRVLGGARIEEHVLKAAQRYEGAAIIGPEVMDAGLHDRRIELPLWRVTMQRLAVEEAIDGVRHCPEL
jgi:hypothetical protein